MDSTLDTDHDDGLAARYQRIEDLLGEGESTGLAACKLEEKVVDLHALSANEPNYFAKVEKNSCWLKAMLLF